MAVGIKICGLTTEESVRCAIDYGADYVGFVFYEPSPRHLQYDLARKLNTVIDSSSKKVAVVVDPTDEMLENIIASLQPDFIQLHGKETVERVHEIKDKFKTKIIKAFAIRDADDVAKSKAYEPIVDMLLFDAKAPFSTLPGGNGVAFDWHILQGRSFAVPWFLSGGINHDNSAQAISKTAAKYVDVSSSVESSPGVKDCQLIQSFIKKVSQL